MDDITSAQPTKKVVKIDVEFLAARTQTCSALPVPSRFVPIATRITFYPWLQRAPAMRNPVGSRSTISACPHRSSNPPPIARLRPMDGGGRYVLSPPLTPVGAEGDGYAEMLHKTVDQWEVAAGVRFLA